MGPENAAAVLSGSVAGTFRFERALAGGKSGANLFVDEQGSRWVIKWVEDPPAIQRRRDAVAVSERLRIEAGWPTPARHVVDVEGRLFVLQEFVPGEVRASFGRRVADQLVEAHGRRLGLADTDPAGDFADHLLMTLRTGADSYCLHEPLRAFDSRGRRFVERVERIGAELSTSDLPANDLIHWDLHPGNVVVSPDGGLAAVIDADHAKVGDAMADMVCIGLTAQLPGTAPMVGDLLRAAALDGLDEARRAAYVAHHVLRFADWAVRDGGRGEVEMWLDLADSWL